MTVDLITAGEFSQAFGVKLSAGKRALARMHAGRRWRCRGLGIGAPGLLLPVMRISNAPGGVSGSVYAVPRPAFECAAAKMRDGGWGFLLVAEGAILPQPQPQPLSPSGDRQLAGNSLGATIARICTMRGDDDGAWRAAVTQEILSADARPANVIKALIKARLAYAWGKKRGLPVSKSTLWEWCKKMKAPDGAAKLQRHGNEGRRYKRVLTWHALDRAMAHLPRERQEAIAQEVHELALSNYSGGAGSPFNASNLMLPDLRAIAEREGIPVPTEEEAFRKVFMAPEGYMRRRDRRRAHKAHQAKRDAQTVSAKLLPRVRRHRDGLRFGDAIEIDVRHHDIQAMRDDGTERTAMQFCIIDVATHRLVAYPFLLPKGENIRRAHVAMALRSYFSDWGVPAWIVADNGKELCGLRVEMDNIAKIAAEHRARHGFIYTNGERPQGLTTLEKLRPPGLATSIPHQPQSKGLIEGAFSIVTKIEKAQEGYLPGNRMQKRTRRLGKADGPGAIGQSGVDDVSRRSIAYYNARPQQKGHIKGLSPNTAMQRDIAAGAPRVLLAEDQFDLVFGNDVERIVQAEGVKHGHKYYRADELLPLVGERVLLRVPILGDGTTMIVVDQQTGAPLFPVHADTPRHMFAMDGAKESARLKRAGMAGLKATAQGAVPIDPASAMDRFAEMFAPEPPADAPVEKIEISPVVAKAASKARTRKQEGANEMKRQIAWLEQGKSNAA